MNVQAYIASGILENYCMGFCTDSESAEIEGFACTFPEIQEEIEHIRTVFEEYLMANKIDPSPKVKFAVMASIYQDLTKKETAYLPLITENTEVTDIKHWIYKNPLVEVPVDFSDIFMHALPSTPHITNFMVWVKNGHPTEVHADFVEYLYVVKGNCTMKFEERLVNYSEGDIIRIPPHIHHSAVVTSDSPMIAIVQRQACA